MAGTKLNGPILGSVATSTRCGYWMVGSDSGIFSAGDATFHGSTGNLKLNKQVTTMAPSPDGCGLWLVASDCSMFAFERLGRYDRQPGATAESTDPSLRSDLQPLAQPFIRRYGLRLGAPIGRRLLFRKRV
jgi:hypothetical protein